MSRSLKQNGFYHLYLCLEPFVFLFLIFKSKHLIITMAPLLSLYACSLEEIREKEKGRGGGGAGRVYNVEFVECRIEDTRKAVFAECLGFWALGKYISYVFISLFSITCFSFFVRCTLEIPSQIDSTIYI